MSLETPFTRAGRARKHDYHLLNDGSDEEADIADRIERIAFKAIATYNYLASIVNQLSTLYSI